MRRRFRDNELGVCVFRLQMRYLGNMCFNEVGVCAGVQGLCLKFKVRNVVINRCFVQIIWEESGVLTGMVSLLYEIVPNCYHPMNPVTTCAIVRLVFDF